MADVAQRWVYAFYSLVLAFLVQCTVLPTLCGDSEYMMIAALAADAVLATRIGVAIWLRQSDRMWWFYAIIAQLIAPAILFMQFILVGVR